MSLLVEAAAITVGAIFLMHIGRLRQELEAERQKQAVLLSDLNALREVQKHHERRLDILFQSVSEAVIRVDRQGRVRAVNLQARKLFSIGEHLELPQPMLLLHRDTAWQQAYGEALAQLPEPATLPDIRIKGQVLAARLTPLGRDQALLLCVDMTRQAQLEEQRKTFLANLIHDLKTPLTAMLGWARTLQSHGHDEAIRQEAAAVLAMETKRINTLLDAMLTLDRIENEPFAGNIRCDAASIVRQQIEAMALRCRERRIRIEYEGEESLPLPLPGEDLARIASNLLDNALRHSPEKGTIVVRIDRAVDRGRIVIVDGGPGIPETQLERVTERFYRLDEARTRDDSGHGLGLAIVKALAQRAGGKLILANVAPHGLKAEVLLPLA